MPKAWKIFHVLKDVAAPVQEMSTPGLSNAVNFVSQSLWGTNWIDTDSAGYQDADTVTMVAGMVLPGPGGKARGSLSATKTALKTVQKIVGKLSKGKVGKFGSPQRGNAIKAYRLDPGHPNAPIGSPEAGPHINWWDFTRGKRGRGGRSGAISIE